MANEFIARKGLIVPSGSILVTSGSVTASHFVGTASVAISSSHAVTASYALNAQSGAGFPFSGSAVITGSLYVSGSTISGSFVGDGAGLTGIDVSTAVISDIYTFVGNGATQTYVLSQSYFPSNVQVSVDGLVFTKDVDYIYTTGSIVFVVAPPSSSNILVSALLNSQTKLTGSFTGSFIGDGHGLTNLPLAINIDTYKFSGDGVTTAYNLNYEYGPNSLFIDVAGITYVHPEDYTISGTTINFTEVPASSSNILIRAFQSQSFLGSSSFSTTSSYVDYANVGNKPTLVSASSQVSYLGLSNIPANIVSSSTQVTAFLPTGTVSSSAQINTGSFSGSLIGTSSWADNVDYSNIVNKPTLVSASSQVDVRNTTGIDTIATTGSNTFTGIQNISDTTNSTSYLDGALVVAGGVGITKDVRISGSLTINGLLTAVSMSTQYVTSSQYNVGVSKITLNDDDNVRFAGLSIYDSGSSSPATASIYWDSLQHRFIYENLSGSAYNSAIIIAGPKNTGSIGDEQELTVGRIPYATGGDHIDNSPVRVINSTVHFDENIYATGSITAAAFTGSVLGTTTTASYVDYTNIDNKPTLVSASSQIDVRNTTGIATIATTGSNTFVGNQYVSGAIFFEGGSSITGNVANLELFADPTGEIILQQGLEFLKVSSQKVMATNIEAISVTGSFSGSLIGTGSWASNAITASYVDYSNIANKPTLVSSSAQVSTGSFTGSFIGELTGTSSWASNAISASRALTASYAENAGAGAGFPYSGSAVITGSLLVIATGSVGGITGSFSGSGAGLTDLRASIGIDSYTFVGNGSTTEYYLSQSYTPNSLLVSVEGINYAVTEDYTLSGPTMSFAVAPPSQSNVVVKAFLAVSSGSYINYTGSFIGDGYGLDNLRGSLAIDEYLFVGDGVTTSYVLSSSYAPPSLNVTVGGLRYVSPNDYTVTGSTINFTQAPVSESLIVFDGFVVVSSGSVGTFSGSFLGNATTATSASYATTSSFASNVLKTKAGSLANTSFGGTPYTASVTFSSAFSNTNYSIAVTGEDARIFTIESKTASGFVVNTNSNTAVTGTTYWTCTAFGEN